MNPFALSGLLIGATSSAMGVFVYFKNPQSKIIRLWSVFTFMVAIWGFGAFKVAMAEEAAMALFYWRVAYLGVILIPVLFIHFVFTFLEKKEKWPIVLAYCIGLFFLIINLSGLLIDKVGWVFDSFYYAGRPPTTYYSVLTFLWFFAIIFCHVLLFRALRRTSSIKRNQIRFFFLATAVGFTGGSTAFMPVFGLDLYPYGNFTVPLYPLIMTYAILRYRLMDINFVLKKSMVYSISVGLLTGLFVIFVMTLTNVFSTFANVGSFKVGLFAAILIALLFNPLRHRVQRLIDKIFYKRTYDYYTTIRKVSHDLASIFDVDKIYSFVGDIIFSTLGLKNIYLLSETPGSGYEVVYHVLKKSKPKKTDIVNETDKKIFRIRSRSDLVKILRESNDIIVKEELAALEAELGAESIENVKSDLNSFESEAVVPVFVDGKLSLLVLLGEKLSGDMFSDEDINLLNTISNQTAIALKNAGLYKDKVNSERLASIGMMSATFAHEIRNPLTSLKTFAQLMPDKYNDTEFRNTFSKIVVGEIERIDGLIGDLLDFSTGKKSARMINFDLKALVNESVDYVKDKLGIEEKNIVFEKNYSKDEIILTGDTKKLNQALTNIIINGCQAMNGDGVLKVDIKPNGKYIDVSIADTGEGIDPDEVSKIFDPFVTSKEMGIGLGLAISKRIIEDHKGKIGVKSKSSRGTTFTISLPVQIE